MKWILILVLLVSVGLNGYFIVDEVRHYQNQEIAKVMDGAMGLSLNATTWKEGLEIFAAKLKEKDTTLLKKKYYYINVWTSWCKPCIKEMPWLDSLAGKLDKDVGYFFVSEMNDEDADKCVKRMGYSVKNFVFLNDMGDFVSAICNEKGTKSKIYPMVLILSNKGELLHSSNGAYVSAGAAISFIKLINELK